MPAVGLAEVLERTTQVATKVMPREAERVDREARWPQEGPRALAEAEACTASSCPSATAAWATA